MKGKNLTKSHHDEDEATFPLSRRDLWQGASLVAAAALTGRAGLASAADEVTEHPGYDPAIPGPGAKTAADYPVSAMTSRLSTYISETRNRDLPAEVVEQTKWHLLDTLAAIVAGSQVPTGRACLAFARANGGSPKSTILGTTLQTDPITAAMANGTMGHGHEIDDTGGASGPWHPGINVVPAAMALGEQFGINGTQFLRAITLGYDIGGRAGTAAGLLRNFRTPTVSVCGYFGAVAAAACVAGLTEEETRWALSYTAQQSSGIDSFRRDPDHIEKGFLNGGMGARGGVTSVLLVQSGFTGVRDIFTGPANFFALFRAAGQQVEPELLVAGLGERYDVLATGFKRRPVAGAIAAVLDSLEMLLRRQRIDPTKIREIIVRYEPNSVTDNAGPVDMNMQHAVAMTLVDGRVTYRGIQDRARFNDPLLVRLRSITRITPVTIYVQTGKYVDPSTPGIASQLGSKAPVIQITMADGKQFSQGDVAARGEASNPYTRDWVAEKARSLMTPVLGATATAQVIERVLAIESVGNVRELGSLLRVSSDGGPPRLSEWPAGTRM